MFLHCVPEAGREYQQLVLQLRCNPSPWEDCCPKSPVSTLKSPEIEPDDHRPNHPVLA